MEKKRTKNYRWCVVDDRAICFSNKTQDKVHNNHFDTINPSSGLLPHFNQLPAERFVCGFCVNIIMAECSNV